MDEGGEWLLVRVLFWVSWRKGDNVGVGVVFSGGNAANEAVGFGLGGGRPTG